MIEKVVSPAPPRDVVEISGTEYAAFLQRLVKDAQAWVERVRQRRGQPEESR